MAESEAKVGDVQNRPGFVVVLAPQVAEKRGDTVAAACLHRVEEIPDRARVVREDPLAKHFSLTQNVAGIGRRVPSKPLTEFVTDLKVQLLPYAA